MACYFTNPHILLHTAKIEMLFVCALLDQERPVSRWDRGVSPPPPLAREHHTRLRSVASMNHAFETAPHLS